MNKAGGMDKMRLYEEDSAVSASASAGRAAISCENMAVGYRGIPLISDISFSVRPGEILTLIGPNGAGKSTILKSITGQLAPLEGIVNLNGKPESELTGAEMARELAVVLTDGIRADQMTCRDVAAMGRYPYTGKLGILSDRDWQKVEEALDRVGAKDIADRSFTQISDGQRQRILLARALCQETGVLVLDEPTSFLDLYYKRSLLRLIRQAADGQHMAVVMSLHELDLARQVSDIIVCVKGSRIWKMGRPEDIFKGDTIEKLFDLPQGGYDVAGGTLNLGLKRG